MAKGPDLAFPAVEGETPKESTEDTERASTQSGAKVEEEEKEPPEDVIPEKDEPKSVKMKLVLKDDPKAEGHKLKRTSKRRLGCELMKKKGASEASEMVEILSEEDNAPHDKRESKAADAGQEEMGSPTKPGENPQLAATKSRAREDAEYPSSNPTGLKEETLIKPEGTPTRISFHPVQEVDVEHQQSIPTPHEEPSGSRKEVSEGEDDEERYQLERKRKGNAPAKKKKSIKKP